MKFCSVDAPLFDARLFLKVVLHCAATVKRLSFKLLAADPLLAYHLSCQHQLPYDDADAHSSGLAVAKGAPACWIWPLLRSSPMVAHAVINRASSN